MLPLGDGDGPPVERRGCGKFLFFFLLTLSPRTLDIVAMYRCIFEGNTVLFAPIRSSPYSLSRYEFVIYFRKYILIAGQEREERGEENERRAALWQDVALLAFANVRRASGAADDRVSSHANPLSRSSIEVPPIRAPGRDPAVLLRRNLAPARGFTQSR